MEVVSKSSALISIKTPHQTYLHLLAPRIRKRDPIEDVPSHQKQRMIFTYPREDTPVLTQLDTHLHNPKATYTDSKTRRYAHPQYGDLGITDDLRAIAVKELIAQTYGTDAPLEVMATMSLAVLYTLIPSYLSLRHDFAETYDIQTDLHWARDEYGKGRDGRPGAFSQLVEMARDKIKDIPPIRTRRAYPPPTLPKKQEPSLTLTEHVISTHMDGILHTQSIMAEKVGKPSYQS